MPLCAVIRIDCLLFPRNEQQLYRIVGFEVEPHSIAVTSMAVVEKNGQQQCALVSGEQQPNVLELKKDCE